MIRAHLLQSTTVSTNNNTLQMQWQTVIYKFLISVLHYVTLVITLVLTFPMQIICVVC